MFPRPTDFLGICPITGVPLGSSGGELEEMKAVSFIGVEVCKKYIARLKTLKMFYEEKPVDILAKIDESIRIFEESMGEEMSIPEQTADMKKRHTGI